LRQIKKETRAHSAAAGAPAFMTVLHRRSDFPIDSLCGQPHVGGTERVRLDDRKTGESPMTACTLSVSQPAPLLVGKNGRGEWVVRDRRGLRGGVFVNRSAALKFAFFENGYRTRAVILVPDGLELDLWRNVSTIRTILPGAAAADRQRAA
jgi:hypothetical protein